MPSLANIDIENPSHIVWAGFIADVACVATADGEVIFIDGKQIIYEAHDGLICATPNLAGDTLVSGGEDGRIIATTISGTHELHKGTGQWIDQIAAGPQDAVAFSSGRVVQVLVGDNEKRIECERTAEGLAFAPKGMRLAVARYNGVDLFWVNSGGATQFLEWKGAHTGVMFSPDGNYVVSLMQENALHGWQLRSGKNMRMTGYPTKVKSMSWSPKGKWLATSGAPGCITWPFVGKDGPMGKAPKELGAMGQVMVAQVACNPAEEIIAIGYENGMILVVKIDDGKEVSLRREGPSAISSLGWDTSGSRLCFGTESGEAGVINLTE